MDLKLIRKTFTEKSTIGELFDGEQFQCFTLEDCVREVEGQTIDQWKIKGQTAIPYGRYQIAITFSNRFQKPLPELLSVPGFAGIRIHPGNTDADTEGCILPGKVRGQDLVGQSRPAFSALFSKLKAAAKTGKVWIEILRNIQTTET